MSINQIIKSIKYYKFFIFFITFFTILQFIISCKNKDYKPYTLGGKNYDSARDILKIKDGYVLAGMTTSNSFGDIDGLWIKLNKKGKKIKQNTYGGKNDDKFYSIIDTNNGFLLLGTTNSYGAGNNDIYLVNIDYNGKLIFSRTFGDKLYDEGKSICKTIDNNFILVGNTNSYSKNKDFDIYLTKIDFNGNSIWSKIIGGSGNDFVSKIIFDEQNKDYILIGSSNSKSKLSDIVLLKIDNDGNIIMQKYYGGSNSDNGYDIIKSKFGNYYYIVGDTSSIDNLTDIYIIKIDFLGNIIWERKYGGKGLDSANSIIETDNKNLIITGFSESKTKGMSDIIIINIDENGIIKWENKFGGIKDEYSSKIIKFDENYFFILGWTSSFGEGDYDIILLKINESGEIKYD